LLSGNRTKIAIALASVAAIAAGAYMGARYLLSEKLYPMLETEASKFLEREVKLGKLQSFSLNGVRIGPVSIPPTATDPDKVAIEAIDVRWQLLPVLQRSTFPFQITLVAPDLHVEQDELGEWVNLEFLEKISPGEPPPVDIEATLKIQEASIALLPNTATTPVTSEINGRVIFQMAKEEIEYDIDADIATGKVNIKGETLIKTGESDISALVQNLPLTEFNPFIPNAVAAIASGQLNADLKAQLPSFQELPSVKGNLNLQSLQIQVPEFPHPVNASAQLDFQGKIFEIEEIKTSYSENLQALVSGKVDLDRGYDIAVAVAPFGLPELLEVAAVESPVEFDGEMQLGLSVTGAIENPEINGILKSTKVTRIDKLEIALLQANFGGYLSQAVLKDLQIIPQAGGSIRGKGEVKLSNDSGEFLEPAEMTLSFDMNAQLPVDEIASPYNLPPDISISNLTAQAQVQGTVAQPEGQLQWQAPAVAAVGVNNISGGGEVTLIDNQVQLHNNRVQIGAGTIAIGGNGDLETGDFQASVRAKAVPIDPFIDPDVPGVTLSNGTVRLAGNLNSPDIDKIAGGADLNLNIAGSRAVVNGKLQDGSLEVKGRTSQIQLNKFIPDLPLTANLLGSSVNLVADLKDLLASARDRDLNSINANANVRLGVEDGTVNANTQINGGMVDVAANTSTISLTPLLRFFLPETSLPPVSLLASQVNILESLDNIISVAQSSDYTSINPTANAKVRLEVGEGRVLATSTVKAGRVDVGATTDRIELTPFLQAFLPETSIAPVTLLSSEVNISESLKGIISAAISQDSSKINPRGKAEARLKVNDGRVLATSTVKAGRVNVAAETSRIELTPFLQDIPVPVTLLESKVDFSESLQAIVSAAVSQDFTQIDPNATANASLKVAEGTLRGALSLEDSKWQTNVTASQLQAGEVLQKLGILNPASKSSLPLNAQVKISGNLDPLVNPQIPSTITADKISVQLAEQFLDASGTALISNLTTAARSVGLELDIAASSDLDAIPFTQLLSMAPVERDFLPTQLNIRGDAEFEGRLLAKNILLDPLTADNLNLTGDLELRDFAFNEMKFDRVLTGPVKADPAREIAINLRGKKDAISAQLTPCFGSACMAPYIPASLEVRQGDGENTFLVRGKQTDDIFKAKIENLALDVLKISPGKQLGIPGAIEGLVNGAVDIDMATLATQGNIEIAKLGLGYREIDRLATSFFYNNKVAQLASGLLQLQDSRYDFNGGLNLNTGEVEGKVNIAQASVQDILLTLNLPSLQKLQEIFAQYQPPTEKASAADVQTLPVGNPEAPVFSQLRQLAQSNVLVQGDRAAETPIYLNIQGDYRGAIALAGTLTNPQIDVDLQGKNWQWRPYQPIAEQFPKNQGAVLGPPQEENRAIAVEEWKVRGSLQDRVIKIEPLRLELGDDSAISFTGELSEQKLGGLFQIEKFSLDTVGNVVELPIDIKGNLNAKATLAGSMTLPQVLGEISFADGTIDDRPLEEIQGQFAYNNNRLDFRTTQPSSMQVQANVPFPIVPENNRAEVDVQLDTEAIALIGLFTQGMLEWVDGKGKVALQASGNLDIEAKNIKNLQATGNVSLENATVKSKAVSEDPLILNGAIALTEKHLQVENLEGNFEKSQIFITGILPIFKPLSNNDPEKPIKISIDEGKLNLNGLYEGQIDTEVTISGSALRPVIAGEVALSNGRVTLPLAANGTPTSATIPSAPAELPIVPKFRDFRVVLGENFRVKRNPLLDMEIDGDVTVNGAFQGSPEDLQPEGTINLRQGVIDVLNNTLLLSRGYESKISFLPSAGLLNPNLDMQMETTVIDSPNNERSQRIQGQRNEIPDSSVGLSRPDEINIYVTVKGDLQQLLLASDENPCLDRLININLPTQGSVRTMDTAELQRLALCLDEEAAQIAANRQLLSRVEITSVPTRSEAEIIALLSNQSVELVKQLASSNEEELLSFAFSRYVIDPVVRDFAFKLANLVTGAGQKIGLSDLSVYPIFEGFYPVNEESVVRIIYDYEFNEMSVQYETRF